MLIAYYAIKIACASNKKSDLHIDNHRDTNPGFANRCEIHCDESGDIKGANQLQEKKGMGNHDWLISFDDESKEIQEIYNEKAKRNDNNCLLLLNERSNAKTDILSDSEAKKLGTVDDNKKRTVRFAAQDNLENEQANFIPQKTPVGLLTDGSNATVQAVENEEPLSELESQDSSSLSLDSLDEYDLTDIDIDEEDAEIQDKYYEELSDFYIIYLKLGGKRDKDFEIRITSHMNESQFNSYMQYLKVEISKFYDPKHSLYSAKNHPLKVIFEDSDEDEEIGIEDLDDEESIVNEIFNEIVDDEYDIEQIDASTMAILDVLPSLKKTLLSKRMENLSSLTESDFGDIAIQDNKTIDCTIQKSVIEDDATTEQVSKNSIDQVINVEDLDSKPATSEINEDGSTKFANEENTKNDILTVSNPNTKIASENFAVSKGISFELSNLAGKIKYSTLESQDVQTEDQQRPEIEPVANEGDFESVIDTEKMNYSATNPLIRMDTDVNTPKLKNEKDNRSLVVVNDLQNKSNSHTINETRSKAKSGQKTSDGKLFDDKEGDFDVAAKLKFYNEYISERKAKETMPQSMTNEQKAQILLYKQLKELSMNFFERPPVNKSCANEINKRNENKKPKQIEQLTINRDVERKTEIKSESFYQKYKKLIFLYAFIIVSGLCGLGFYIIGSNKSKK